MGQYGGVDYLTGLKNRKGVTDYINSLPGELRIHYMFLDMDNFKTVNDVYGHQAGDETLVLFAGILKECVRDGVVGRMGGDEFVVVLTGEKEKQEIADLAGRILLALEQQGKEQVYLSLITVSIGIMWDFLGRENRELLMFNSDYAMYEAKNRGKNCFVFFDEIEERVKRERDMKDQLRASMDPRQFPLYFQGLIHLQSSSLEETEVMADWYGKNQGVWKAREYRPLMERMGVIRQIDLLIFEKLCREMGEMHCTGKHKIKIRIELSHLLFLDSNLGELLSERMSPCGLKPKEFDLGIDEAAFNDRDAGKLIANMNRLAEMGFSLTICHFGKDFSCFRYLRDLPVHSLQFDENFLKENLGTHRGRKIIKTLVKMGKELKLMVSAVEITRQKEVEYLSGYGCDAALGEFYGEPMKLSDYISYMEKKIRERQLFLAYPFLNDLCTRDGNFAGEMVGDGITFEKGISDRWGALRFPGGAVGTGVVHLPALLFPANSYTVSMWIKPEKVIPWGSLLYLRYGGGFMSLIPNVGDGVSVFRINEDQNTEVWHDVLCRAVNRGTWNMLTVTYNAFNETSVYYINGRKAGRRLHVPTLLSCRQVILGGDPFQESFQGSVSALMVIQTVKTEEEIHELYQEFTREPGFCGDMEDCWMDGS